MRSSQLACARLTSFTTVVYGKAAAKLHAWAEAELGSYVVVAESGAAAPEIGW